MAKNHRVNSTLNRVQYVWGFSHKGSGSTVVITITLKSGYKYKIRIRIPFELSTKLLSKGTIYCLYRTFLLRSPEDPWTLRDLP